MTSLYNCKSEIDADGKECWRITKFDGDMNVGSSYHTDGDACSCPAGVRHSCRHRDMLPKFIARAAVNTHWFYDFDRGGWISSDVHLEGALASAEPQALVDENDCPGHVASEGDPKVCAHCGVHIDSLRPDDEPSVPSDPGTQLPIAGDRQFEARSALCTPQSTPLLRRF